MFSSPCHVPDTLHFISPGFREVDKTLASERPRNLPEPHGEKVAGPGFRGCLTLSGHRCPGSPHLLAPGSWWPHLRTPYKSCPELEAASFLSGPWETDATPPRRPYLHPLTFVGCPQMRGHRGEGRARAPVGSEDQTATCLAQPGQPAGGGERTIVLSPQGQ